MERIYHIDHLINKGVSDILNNKNKCVRRNYGAFIFDFETKSFTRVCITSGCLKPKDSSFICYRDFAQYKSGEGYHYCPSIHAEESAVKEFKKSKLTDKGGVLFLFGIEKDNLLMDPSSCPNCKKIMKENNILACISIDLTCSEIYNLKYHYICETKKQAMLFKTKYIVWKMECI